jgi:hypothetical protein
MQDIQCLHHSELIRSDLNRELNDLVGTSYEWRELSLIKLHKLVEGIKNSIRGKTNDKNK